MTTPNEPQELRQTMDDYALECLLRKGPEVLGNDLASRYRFVSALAAVDASMHDKMLLHPDCTSLPEGAIHLAYDDPATLAAGFRYGNLVVSAGMLTQLAHAKGIIHSIFTRPEFEHLGLAHAVLAKLLQVAIGQQLTAVSLRIHPENDPARRIYVKAGFTTDGQLRHDGSIEYWLHGDAIYRGIGRLALGAQPPGNQV